MKKNNVKFIGFIIVVVALTSTAFLNSASTSPIPLHTQRGAVVDSTDTESQSNSFVEDVDLVSKLIQRAQNLLF